MGGDDAVRRPDMHMAVTLLHAPYVQYRRAQD